MIKFMESEIKLTRMKHSKRINTPDSLSLDIVMAMVTIAQKKDNKYSVFGIKTKEFPINSLKSTNSLKN